MNDADQQPDERPDFGPRGYLPDRASRRARKIVLRAEMGIQWVIGALVVAVGLGVAGYLVLRDDTPQPPYELVVEDLTALDAATELVSPTHGALLLTAGGRPRVLMVDTGSESALPRWCEASGLLEDGDGRAWRATGRGLGGAPSLAEYPSVIHDGGLWVDLSTTLPAPAPSDAPAELAC